MSRWLPLIISILISAMLLHWTYNNIREHNKLIQNTEVRAAIDIGSGTTNLKVARVDPATNKIISIIYDQTIPVLYQAQLEKTGDNQFNAETIKSGIDSIATLKQAALQQGAKKVVAVATAAFRSAVNGPAFVEEIEKQTGVQVRIIDQDEEGILAFRGALALTPMEPLDTIVWDIGGGSMQLTALTKEGTYIVEKGKTASIPFRNFIIQNLQNGNIEITHSPNPMTPEVMDKAIEYARMNALETSPFIIEKIKDPKTSVLAVGNLLTRGIRKITGNKDTTTEPALNAAVKSFANKNDAEVGQGVMSEIYVSNALLVDGYMQGLNMKEIQFVQVNNADGALTYPPYWS